MKSQCQPSNEIRFFINLQTRKKELFIVTAARKLFVGLGNKLADDLEHALRLIKHTNKYGKLGRDATHRWTQKTDSKILHLWGRISTIPPCRWPKLFCYFYRPCYSLRNEWLVDWVLPLRRCAILKNWNGTGWMSRPVYIYIYIYIYINQKSMIHTW